MHRAAGYSDYEWFTQPGQYSPDLFTIHAHGTVRSVFYAAVESKKRPGEVWALVIKLWRTPNSYYNFTEKAMDETVGPVYTDAPKKVLDLLTPTDSEWANEWRAACRKKIAHHEWVKQNVRPGTTFKIAEPLSFSDGRDRDTFTYTRENGREVIRSQDGYRVGLSRWRDRVTAVV